MTPQLYQSCRKDAIQLCSAKQAWQDWSTDVDNGPLVLPCLFHHLSDEDNNDDNQIEPDEIRNGKVCIHYTRNIKKKVNIINHKLF